LTQPVTLTLKIIAKLPVSTLILPPTLPAGNVGVGYNQSVAASGGIGPYVYSVAGPLPTGLTLDVSTGTISGIVTEAISAVIVIYAVDSTEEDTGSMTYTLTFS
jgi:large repetitive protein